MSGVMPTPLSSMTTDAVCERVRQMEGIDQGMVGQYTATIRKVGVTPCRLLPLQARPTDSVVVVSGERERPGSVPV